MSLPVGEGWKEALLCFRAQQSTQEMAGRRPENTDSAWPVHVCVSYGMGQTVRLSEDKLVQGGGGVSPSSVETGVQV